MTLTRESILWLAFISGVLPSPSYGQHIEGDTWHNTPHCGLDTISTSRHLGSDRSTHRDGRHEQSRIAGGFNAAPGQYPYFAQIVQVKKNRKGRVTGRDHICGAAIITPEVLLTAAHCVEGAQHEVRMGIVQAVIQSVRSGEGPLIAFDHYVIHPERREYPEYADLALVFISQPIYDMATGRDDDIDPSGTRRELANTVCLPEDDTQFGEYATYETMGYGDIGVGSPQDVEPVELQAARLRTPSPAARRAGIECGNAITCYAPAKMLIYNEHNQTQVCRGDSGGPLVHMDQPTAGGGRQRATLAGILQGGNGKCNTTRTISVFARVTYFMPWIRDEVKKYWDRS